GVISYIFKNKLQDAYNLRNKIHQNHQDMQDEEKLALDLHQRLYYISKKYFRDFCENQRYINIPEYKKPERIEIHFDDCIICGSENEDSASNMCGECNRKIDNANILLGIKNSFENQGFSKRDLISYGITESECISLLMDLTRENLISKKGELYHINDDNFQRQLEKIDEYIEIGLLLTKFYSDEISSNEIKSTLEYWKGGINQKPYREFYRLVNLKLEKKFEDNICKMENIKKAMKASSMDNLAIQDWFVRKKEDFINGDLNDAFILYNEILIKDYFKLKKKNIDESKIKYRLQISEDLYNFWENEFMGEDFLKMTTDIKKDLILKEIKKNKSLKEALSSVGISEKEFDRLYLLSQKNDDKFYEMFSEIYIKKRQKTFLKHLEHNNLNSAIRISKISPNEFHRWYADGEAEYSDFYIEATKLLIDKYLKLRKRGWKKHDILKKTNITKNMLKSWLTNTDLDFLRDFQFENSVITSNLIKRGKVINALKEDYSKIEAIYAAEMTPNEFKNIYNASKIDNSEFYKRFDAEYRENRKRLFPKLLKDNDFYSAIQKCEITQRDFNRWYQKDQDKFMVTGYGSDFYVNTTRLLMQKYIRERLNGKNKPDSAKSAGVSNTIVNKWLNHLEYDLFCEFKRDNDILEMDLIKKGFGELKSKTEISEMYDITPSTIDEFISYGRKGLENFKELFKLYENKVIPHQLEIFMKSIKNKAFNKALKDSKLTLDEFEYYYEQGKSSKSRFHEFYNDYLELKREIYAENIVSKKSKRIALKNSNLTEDELKDNCDAIEDLILSGRVDLMASEIEKHKNTGVKLAKSMGVSVEEIYDWYIRGKNGDEKYSEFALIFELGVVLPRSMAFAQAMHYGIPKNQLHKKLKKELGSTEYNLWDKYGIIDQQEMNYIKLDGEEVDEKRIISLLKNSEYFRCCFRDNDPETFEMLKKAAKGNSNFMKSQRHVSKKAEVEVAKGEIVGK
ncbi:MAG: hypothetical protein IJ287_10700, partial [Methanobrevibacter sp.]|nr:hypothetical protein [Methanobrevibacter sp.]